VDRVTELRAIVETENVIQYIVAPAIRDELEDLAELQGVGAVIHNQQPCHADDETRYSGRRRLRVAGGDLVLD